MPFLASIGNFLGPTHEDYQLGFVGIVLSFCFYFGPIWVFFAIFGSCWAILKVGLKFKKGAPHLSFR